MKAQPITAKAYSMLVLQNKSRTFLVNHILLLPGGTNKDAGDQMGVRGNVGTTVRAVGSRNEQQLMSA